MDIETYNNVQNTLGALQQLQNAVTAIQDQQNAKKQLDIASSNLELNKTTAEKNYNLQLDQFNYQKQLNDLMMKREDTAFQRQVADLQAAGLSPLNISGGASAQPLNAGTAPQKDVSGINQAVSNLFGAYNDYYTRKLNRQNFALQNRVQTAQAYTMLAESKLNQEKMKIEKQILDTDLKFYQDHPQRNLGLEGVLINVLSNILQGNQRFPQMTESPVNVDEIKTSLLGTEDKPKTTNKPKIINPPTSKQIKQDQNKLSYVDEQRYNQYAASIENVRDINSEAFNKAVSYFWNYYAKYDDTFNSFDSFKSKLVNDKNYRSKIRSNFKYKAPSSSR